MKNAIGKRGNDGSKKFEIWVPLKSQSNFWRTSEMPLINCEINLILTCSEDCILKLYPKFAIIDTKSTKENVKL